MRDPRGRAWWRPQPGLAGARALARAALAAAVLAAAACGGGTITPAPADLDGGASQRDGAAPGDGATPGDGAAADAPLETGARLADGVTIRDVTFFQTVAAPLAHGGAPITGGTVPILAGRAGVLRVSVDLAAGYAATSVHGEATLTRPGAPPTVLSDEKLLARASRDGDPGSHFSFAVAAADVTTATTFAVRLTTATAPTVTAGIAHPARYPVDGLAAAALGPPRTAPGMLLVLVPVRFDSDGSGRLPDTSPAQLERYRALASAVYPLAAIEITVHAPLPFSGAFGFNALNAALLDRRAADSPPARAYYYGLVSPAATFDDYCGWSCTTGQSYVVDDPADADLRIGSGMGFAGDDAAWTLVHEVGHEHGRSHAPCDVSWPDPDYPYAGGAIGVWGWDPRTAVFQDPAQVADFMGYCDPTWTSDYTYRAIYDRLVAVGQLPERSGARAPYRLVAVAADGALTPGPIVRLRTLPRAGRRAVRWHDGPGRLLAHGVGALARHAHGGSATLIVPLEPAGARSLTIDGARGGARTRVELPR